LRKNIVTIFSENILKLRKSITMSETWLKPHVLDNFVDLFGYHLIRFDQVRREGRGESIGFYVRAGLRAKILAFSQEPEYLIVSIFAADCSRPYLLAVIYRYLSTDFEKLYRSFSLL